MTRSLSMLVLALLSAAWRGCSSPECSAPLDMGWQYSVLLHVKDSATNAVVGDPTFAENAMTVSASCYVTSSLPDMSSSDCERWSVHLLGFHNITVSAAGYESKTITTDNDYMIGGCPAQKQVEETVLLTHS